MELSFLTKELRKVCEEEHYGKDILGNERSQLLRSRLADLSAAQSLNDLIPGTLNFNSSDGTFKLKTGTDFEIIFFSIPETPTLTLAGSHDISKVRRIKIISVG